MRQNLVAAFTVCLAVGGGCAGSNERAARSQFSAWSSPRAQVGVGDQKRASVDHASLGSLASYTALALSDSPEIRAAFERWQGSVQQISQARRLPEPTVSFSYFIRSVETRVGPQRAKLGLQQTFPWPTKLSAGADAAAARARSLQLKFDAKALAVQARVSEAYWSLWLIRAVREIHREHLLVIRGLSETVLARLATGAATLADQQQVDLTAARLEDAIRGLDEMELAASAALRAVVSLDSSIDTPTSDAAPGTGLPNESAEELTAMVKAHPSISAIGESARASEELARAKRAERFPSFSLRADWVITGDSPAPNVVDNGKDAVAVGAGIRLPLWQRNYGDAQKAAQSEARARRAEQESAIDQALAQLELRLSQVRDATRRFELYSGTLLPQAETAYTSLLGSYATGRGTVAQALLLQRDLLELRVEVQRAHAQHASAWAQLEFVVGEMLTSTGPQDEGARSAAPPHDTTQSMPRGSK